MSPRATMRPHLLSLALLLALTVAVPLVSAVCISWFEKTESKSEAHGAAAIGGSIKRMTLDEYGLPKKVAEKPKEVNPYEETTSAKACTTFEKHVEEDKESSAPKKVKKEKSDDSDVSAVYLKKEKKEKSSESVKKEKKKYVDFDVSGSPKKEKKEKSDDSDESSSSKKKRKEKSDGSDEYHISPKKEKKEKSDDSDESSSLKKKKEKSDGSGEYDASPKKKEKKEKKEKKSDDSDENASAKKEKKKKVVESYASDYFKKEKEAEKAKKKKDKSSDSSENEEKSNEDAAPVDVSTTGEYVFPKKAKAEEDTTPADASTVPSELSPAAKSYADEFASQKTSQQPIRGASPDELPPSSAKQSSTAASSDQVMGGSPDELPTSAIKSPAAASSDQVMGGAPDELPPSASKSSGDSYASVPNDPKKPKLSMESFGGNLNMIKLKPPLLPHPHMPVSPVTKSVCANTGYPEDCEESIAELPGGAGVQPAADPVAVLRLAMEAVRDKAIVAMNAATDRMNAAGMEPVVKEALNDCAKSYMDIKAVLDEVDAALKRGDLATARTNLDSVETDVTTCDDGFAERGTPSVMTDHDQELQKLASDLIAIGANSIHNA